MHDLLTNGLFIIKEMRLRRSLVKIVGVSKVCDQISDRVSKNDKSCHICSKDYKGLLAKCGKYGTLSIHVLFFTE